MINANLPAKLFHIDGRELIELPFTDIAELLDGDVYVFDEGTKLYIWVGKDSSVDEQTVAAWLTNKIDNEERGGIISVITVLQDREPSEFLEKFNFRVKSGGTPGFIKRAQLDSVEYKLFHIYTESETIAFDEAFIEEVPISRENLKSGDVYVLDGNESLYCWIGLGANIEEKRMGQKLVRKMDAERSYIPLQYTIYEGEQSKSEHAFYTLLDKVQGIPEDQRQVISVEDKREEAYQPQRAQTVAEHKEELSAPIVAPSARSTVYVAEKQSAPPSNKKFDLNYAIRGLSADTTFERSNKDTAIDTTFERSDKDTATDTTSGSSPSIPSTYSQSTPKHKDQVKIPTSVDIEDLSEEAYGEHVLKPSEIAARGRIFGSDRDGSVDGSATATVSAPPTIEPAPSPSIVKIDYQDVDVQGDEGEHVLKPSEMVKSGVVTHRRDLISNATSWSEPIKTYDFTPQNCLAGEMHHYAFKDDKSCTVCGANRGSRISCVAEEMHRFVWEAGKSCTICGKSR